MTIDYEAERDWVVDNPLSAHDLIWSLRKERDALRAALDEIEALLTSTIRSYDGAQRIMRIIRRAKGGSDE
jgi:hypothetical protein